MFSGTHKRVELIINFPRTRNVNLNRIPKDYFEWRNNGLVESQDDRQGNQEKILFDEYTRTNYIGQINYAVWFPRTGTYSWDYRGDHARIRNFDGSEANNPYNLLNDFVEKFKLHLQEEGLGVWGSNELPHDSDIGFLMIDGEDIDAYDVFIFPLCAGDDDMLMSLEEDDDMPVPSFSHKF